MNCKCILFHMLVSLYLQENTGLSLTFCNLSDIEKNSNNNNIKTIYGGGGGGGGEFSSRKNFFPVIKFLE